MSKVTAYTENTAPSSDDMLYIVDSAAGATPTGKKVQVESILSAITSAAGGGGATGSSGAILNINATPALSWLAKPSSGSILTYSTAGTTGPVWTKTDPGTVMVGSTLNAPTMLAAAASGAILSYSTAGTSGAAWSVPTSGSILIGDADGKPEWLALPASNAILQFSTTSDKPAWTIPSSHSILTASSQGGLAWLAGGTPGQLLNVGATAGEFKWGGLVGCGVRIIANQAALATAVYVGINWTQIDWDPMGMCTTGANSSVVTIKVPGTYFVSGNICMNASQTGVAITRIANGSSYPVFGFDAAASAAADSRHAFAPNFIQTFSSGETLILQAYGSSVENVTPLGANNETHLSIMMVG